MIVESKRSLSNEIELCIPTHASGNRFQAELLLICEQATSAPAIAEERFEPKITEFAAKRRTC